MGIKNFMKIIYKYAPHSVKIKKITDYKNTIIGIDANLLFYKQIYAIRKNGYDLKNGEHLITHIHSLLQKLISFYLFNINAVFVYDGISPLIKEDTLRKREKFSNIMKEKYFKAVTQDEKKKYYFMKSNITYDEIMDCRELIDIFGFTQIDSIEEADSQLADLSKKNKINYIATDDLDILIFGGKIVLKNFSIDKKKKIIEINLNDLLKELNLNQNQIVDLGILLGCDYCPTLKGIGTFGAFKNIQQYKSIENIIINSKFDLQINYSDAKNYFLNPPVIDSNLIQIKQPFLDKKRLVFFLEKHLFNQKYINNVLERLDFIQ